MPNNIFKKLTVKVMEKYIQFVYNTSKITVYGNKKILNTDSKEKVILLFWHEDSYCLYPALKDSKLYIVTTKDKRGDYISDMCNYFGYKSLRVPDASDGGNYIFKMRELINKEDISNIAISIDGPLGPYHVPKDFPIACATFTKRRVMSISIKAKRQIRLKKRWDNFKIPLPFNQLTINFYDPIEITKEDRKEKFCSLKNKIKSTMENNL